MESSASRARIWESANRRHNKGAILMAERIEHIHEKQITARARMYMGASREAYEKGNMRAYGVPDLPYWPGDGSTVCLTNCKCYVVYSNSETGAIWETYDEGGPGSGHWGHAGVPGSRGGSAPSGGVVGGGGAAPEGARMYVTSGPTAAARQKAAAAAGKHRLYHRRHRRGGGHLAPRQGASEGSSPTYPRHQCRRQQTDRPGKGYPLVLPNIWFWALLFRFAVLASGAGPMVLGQHG